jgi:hypothetical protein
MVVLRDSGGIEGGRVAGRRAVPVDPGGTVLLFFFFLFNF